MDIRIILGIVWLLIVTVAIILIAVGVPKYDDGRKIIECKQGEQRCECYSDKDRNKKNWGLGLIKGGGITSAFTILIIVMRLLFAGRAESHRYAEGSGVSQFISAELHQTKKEYHWYPIFLFIFIALDVILLGLGSYLYRYGSEQVECKQGSGDCLCRIEKDPVAKKFGKTLWVIGTGMLVTVVVVPGVLFGITKVFK